MTYGYLAALLVSVWLYKGIGYLSLTAFELLAAGIIFTWLVVFIRQIAAGADETFAQKQPRARLVRS